MPVAQDKQELILLAARKMFASAGYPAATIAKIAAEAGVARGLVHHYFDNKENLYIQVIRSLFEGALGPADLDQLPASSPAELASQMVAMLRQAFRSAPDFFVLDYESLSVARRSEPVRIALQQLWRTYRHRTEEAIEQLRGRGVLTSARPAAEIATVAIALIHGVGLQVLGEPEVADREGTWSALEGALLALLTEP